MKTLLPFLAALVFALLVGVPAFAAPMVDKSAEELAKEFKKDFKAALNTYGDTGGQKGNNVSANTTVKVTGVVEKIDGKKVSLKTNVPGIKLDIVVEKEPKDVKVGDTVKMSHHAGVKSFIESTILTSSESVEKITGK